MAPICHNFAGSPAAGCYIVVMRTAIYPGSFDPITNGHLDLVERGAKLFDRVVVAVAVNSEKKPLFTLQERVEMVRAAIKSVPEAEVDSFDGLLVDYVGRRGSQAILRGLRAVSDFEFEFQLALMNRKLDDAPGNHLHDAEGNLHIPEFAHGQGDRPPGRERQPIRA